MGVQNVPLQGSPMGSSTASTAPSGLNTIVGGDGGEGCPSGLGPAKLNNRIPYL